MQIAPFDMCSTLALGEFHRFDWSQNLAGNMRVQGIFKNQSPFEGAARALLEPRRNPARCCPPRPHGGPSVIVGKPEVNR